MENMDEVRTKVQELVREGFSGSLSRARLALAADAEWKKVRDTGTKLWLDTGDLDEAAKLYTAEFEALTTNNTLLNNEVQKGIYDSLIAEAASTLRATASGLSDKDLTLEISFVLNARHGLRLADEFGANVSVELHTDLAYDVERSVDYGKRYYAICPERFIIKIPLTPAGFLAARKLSSLQIPVNFTLGFSARQNYVAALLSRPAFVNVFMGRLGAFVADNHLGSGEQIGEKATLSTQRELLALRRQARTQTLLIGASMRKGFQVSALAGLDVFTMPTKVAAEYRQNPLERVSSRIEDDPEVPLADGVRFDDFNGTTLWQVPEPFKVCVESLLRKDCNSISPEALQAHFHDAGMGDFLPKWSAEDIETTRTEGKIPRFAEWKDRLTARQIGLDALLNLAALYSFVTDQAALDARIQSLI